MYLHELVTLHADDSQVSTTRHIQRTS